MLVSLIKENKNNKIIIIIQAQQKRTSSATTYNALHERPFFLFPNTLKMLH